MSKSLIRKNQLHPDIADLVSEYGSGFFVSVFDEQVVYTTGNQTISGNKTFATGIVTPLRIGNPGDANDAKVQLWEQSSDSYQSIGSVDGGFTFTVENDSILEIQIEPEQVRLQGANSSYGFLSGYVGTVPIDANVVHVTGGNETISGVKNFTTRPTLSGLNLITTGDLVDLEIQLSGLENAQIINQTNNFSISGNGYGKVITANSSVLITGSIMGGNAIGFNTSIIQVGPGQIQITGDGIKIDSYNNQYRTAGPFATISLLHTGNNGYIMYGNTSS